MNKEKLNDIICESSSDYDILNDAYNYIENLEQKCKKQKEVIDKLEKYIEKETRIYGLSMSIELETHFDNILGMLKEVK